MKEAGINIICKFTPEQAAGLKKEMTYELWRLVKRALKQVSFALIVIEIYRKSTEKLFECKKLVPIQVCNFIDLLKHPPSVFFQ